MPELPEVETIARALKPDLVGRTILSATCAGRVRLPSLPLRQFKKRIAGQEIMDIRAAQNTLLST